MEKNFSENMGKGIHSSLHEASEDAVIEKRLVFMSESAPAAGEMPEAEAPAAPEVQDRESQDAEAARQKVKEGEDFLTTKLDVPEGLKAAFLANIEVKVSDISSSEDGATVESVTASYRNIEFTIDKETTDDQANQLKEFAQKLTVGNLKDFTFHPGSKVDLESNTVVLEIDMKETVEGGFPDSLTISLTDGKITEYVLGVEPAVTPDSEFKKYLDANLIGKSLDDLNLALMQDISSKAEEMGVLAGLETDEGSKEKSAEDGKTSPITVDLGTLFREKGSEMKKHNFQDGQVIEGRIGGREFVQVTVHKEGEATSFSCELPFFEGVKIPFEIKDNGTMVMQFGEKEVTISGEKTKAGGKITMEGLGMESKDNFEIEFNGDAFTLKFNGKPIDQNTEVDAVSLFGGAENLKKAGFSDAQIAGMASMPFAPSASTDDGSEDEESTDGKEGKKKSGTLDKWFGPGASENIGSFMGTLEELAAVVLELLESLGFDLNSKKNKDGSDKTPEQRETRRLQLFVGKNGLGMKNIGKLKSATINDLLGDGGCYVDGDQSLTIAALSAAGFDTDSVHGEKMYEMLGTVHKRMDEKPEIKQYREANPDMDLNTFLADTKMINMNGGWSNEYKKFDGRSPEEKAAAETAAEAAAATEAAEAAAAQTDLPDVAAIKEILELTNPGGADADKITDYFINTGLTLGQDGDKKIIKVTADKKNAFKKLLSQPVRDIELSFNLLDQDGKTNFATNAGLKPEDLSTLINWLHNPEYGTYADTNMTLISLYGLSKPYTLADLMAAGFNFGTEVTPAA